MDIKEFLEIYSKGKLQGSKLNQFASNPTNYTFTDTDIEKFNLIYKRLLSSDLNTLLRTESGGIKICYNNNYAWDCVQNKLGVKLTACVDGFIYVFRLGRPKFNETNMQGWKAWKIFNELCAKNNINLDDYAIDNGEEVKQTIESPLINMRVLDETLTNVHHIDYHNSYPAGLCNTHPEFYKIINPLYETRNIHPENKDILNCVIGYMQSVKSCKAKWAHLSRDAISDNNTRILSLALTLEGNGRKIIGFNTDGIWYQGKIYHGKGEGQKLGEWHNDHTNCIFRAKSHGAYEFIENGKYTPVVRGLTLKDTYLDRTKWKWGDIYQEDAEILKYKFIQGEGVVKYED
jgi:hypothetical protein